MRLYTLWKRGTAGEIAFAVLHCSAGDVAIAASVFVLRARGWPERGFGAVAAGATATGAVYTVFSEWLNTEERGAWSYADAMPRLPPLGTGLLPPSSGPILPLPCLRAARKLGSPSAGGRGADSPVTNAPAHPSAPSGAATRCSPGRFRTDCDKALPLLSPSRCGR